MITLTLLTQPDCTWCSDGKQLLAGLSREFPLSVDEVDLHSEQGRILAARHRLLFAPGLIADGRLIAHGRLSARALRRDLTLLCPTPDH
ncbi:hypothetical protein [Arthrobacter cavernae]|uniref:Thioredoxin family protein n=1 Tax=Arthrobacter cavernae TaxID=2817681 RepID=A0A939HI52_9MICC|nr:hypothetical protein [Arthrobacter cavernae]MBO1269674.1 hypothetical protein [Arthrobacter cavernae]